MQIAVIGAGAVGSYLAASLARAGVSVSLLARGERLAWLRNHPVEIESLGMAALTMVRALDWQDVSEPFDLAIICTKTPGLAEALGSLQRHLKPGGIVVTVQNGVDAPQLAARALPGAAILASRFHGFFETEGQLVRHVGVAPSVAFGAIADPAGNAERVLADILGQAEIAYEVSPEISAVLWKKFMLAASLGGLGAAWGMNAGEIFAVSTGEETLRGAMREVAALAGAFHVLLDETDVKRAMTFALGFPATARTSLQRDLEASRPSEYDALIGAILRMADAERVPVPLFAEFDRAIRQKYPMLEKETGRAEHLPT